MARRPTVAAATLAAALAASTGTLAEAQNADFIWYGGPILAGKDVRPEALAVKDGKIAALGTRADVEKRWKGRLTLPIDLHGQSLVAGVVAAPPPAAAPTRPAGKRIERTAVAKIQKTPAPAPRRTPPPPATPQAPGPPLEKLAADVSPPPDGLPYSIASLRDALRAWMLRSTLPKRHHIVLGFGYDVTKLAERRPPTREELDTVSATVPVVVVSRAGDAGAYNTIALQKAGVSWRTKDPPGGVIRRRGRIFEPNGVLEGTAHSAAFAKLVPRLDERERALLWAASVRLNAPEEPEAGPAAVTVAAVTPAPTPAPTAAPAPVPAPAAAAASPPQPAGPREPGSAALLALVADVLSGDATLQAGRTADMSVLSDDPTVADPARRLKLRVVEEVRRGRTVWRLDPTRH